MNEVDDVKLIAPKNELANRRKDMDGKRGRCWPCFGFGIWQ
jgi:hypothetical protein